MSFEQAIRLLPQWVQYWAYCQLIGAFILPFALLIWRESRLAGAVSIIASVAAGFSTNALYNAMGYTRLIGLGHIIFWTPLLVYLVLQLRRGEFRSWPKWITIVIAAVLFISLAFDYADCGRYLLGERTAIAMPPAK